MLTPLLLSACSVFGVRSTTPEPKFTVISQIGPVEIRHYAPRIAAETTVQAGPSAARYQGFRRLAAYIFGANHRHSRIAMTTPVAQSPGERIAMTAPVTQSPSAQGWVIRFYMPANETLDTLPMPDDPQVRLVTVAATDDAVLRFSGSRSPAAVEKEQRRLLELLAKTPWHPVGTPVAWFYDPPWTLPAFRRNEVAVEVRSAT